MSSLILASSSSAAAEKGAPEIVIPKFKGDLSYTDALKVMATYDVVIKEAATRRKSEVKDYFPELENHHYKKGVLSTAGAVIFEAALAVTGVIDVGISVAGVGETLTLMGTLVGGLLFTIGTANSRKVMHALSPLKAKKIQEKYELEKALTELKENEFAELEAKILKKIKKAVKVIDEYLKYENRKVVYSNDKGNEGFSIEKSAPLNSWEAELLRVEKSTMTTNQIDTKKVKELSP